MPARGTGGTDDISAIYEVITRRFRRYLAEREKTGELDTLGDPDPEVESMLGTEIKDGAALNIIGQANQLRLETDRITLKVMATDASGNVSVQTKQLAIRGKPE